MNAKNLLTFQGVVSTLFGLAFVLLTSHALDPYLIEVGDKTPMVIYIARLFGALLLGFGIGCLMQRGNTNHTPWMFMIIIANGINVIVMSITTSGGLVSSLNWSSVALSAVLALWGAYVLINQKQES